MRIPRPRLRHLLFLAIPLSVFYGLFVLLRSVGFIDPCYVSPTALVSCIAKQAYFVRHAQYRGLFQDPSPHRTWALAPDGAVARDEVLYLVMSGSPVLDTRGLAIMQSWVQWVTPGRVYLLADTKELSPRCGRDPWLCADYVVEFPDTDPSRDGAQQRSLLGLLWAWRRAQADGQFANVRWFALVDDDTFVNVPKVLDILSVYNSSLPLMIGNLIDQDQHWPSGGAGMFFTRAAAAVFAPLIEAAIEQRRSDVCVQPRPENQDMEIGRCAAAGHFLMVHNEFLCPLPLFRTTATHWGSCGTLLRVTTERPLATWHYVTPDGLRLVCDRYVKCGDWPPPPPPVSHAALALGEGVPLPEPLQDDARESGEAKEGGAHVDGSHADVEFALAHPDNYTGLA